MLVDANILLFAIDETSRFHAAAAQWLEEQLNGRGRVGLPWLSLGAFLRISTHPRAFERPLAPEHAWQYVQSWLEARNVWIPVPTDRHAGVLEELMIRYDIRGTSVTDARIAALAVEHGLTVCSADTDFARFTEVRWLNPVAPT